MEEDVGVGGRRAAPLLDQHHPVGPFQVVGDGLGPHEGALLVGPAEEDVDQVALEAEVGLGQAPQAGQLHGQHGGGMLEGDPFVLAGGAGRVDEGEDADGVVPGHGHRHQAALVPYRLGGPDDAVEDLRPGRRRRLRIGIGAVGPGPGPEVPEAVLDRHRIAGHLVERLGDAGLTLAGQGHPGEAVVDLHAEPQRRDRPFEVGVGPLQVLGGGALPGVEAGVAEGQPGLVGQHPAADTRRNPRWAPGGLRG